CSSLVAYLAAHQGSRDSLRGAAEHDRGCRVLPGEERRALERDDDEVSALARLERFDLVRPGERAGRAEGGQLESLRRGHHVGAAGANPREADRGTQLV